MGLLAEVTRFAASGTLNRASVRLVGIDPGVGLEHLPRAGQGEPGVAADLGVGEDVFPGEVGVVVAEPVAPVVAVPAELRLAALGLEPAVVGAEAEVAAVDASPFRRS